MEEWKKCKTWEAQRDFALKHATDKAASFIRVTQTEALKSQNEVFQRYRVAPHLGNCRRRKVPSSSVRPRHDGEVDALRS